MSDSFELNPDLSSAVNIVDSVSDDDYLLIIGSEPVLIKVSDLVSGGTETGYSVSFVGAIKNNASDTYRTTSQKKYSTIQIYTNESDACDVDVDIDIYVNGNQAISHTLPANQNHIAEDISNLIDSSNELVVDFNDAIHCQISAIGSTAGKNLTVRLI